MIDAAEDIHPLTAFKRQTSKFARLLKKTHRPVVLTVEGKARFVVFDAEAYEDWKRRVETIEAVHEALSEEGEGRPASDVHVELRQKALWRTAFCIESALSVILTNWLSTPRPLV